MASPDVAGTHEGKPLFQVIFLKKDNSQSVWVDEVEEINFSEIRKHIEKGEAVFIASDNRSKLLTNPTARIGDTWKKPSHPNEEIRVSTLETVSIGLLSSIVLAMQSHKLESYGTEIS